MRIERKGKVAKLTPRLERFFAEALGGEALDNVQHAESRKADYRCLRGLLAVELKSLEENASERINNLTDELRERDDWPEFIGSAPIMSIVKHLNEPEDVQRRLVERIGRAIKNHIHKANKQLAAHESAFPRKNMVKIVVLANENHEIYDPKLVAHIVHHLLLRQDKGELLYPHIDMVLFLTERHAAAVNGRIALPAVSIEGLPIERALWKRDVTNLVLARWAAWNNHPLFQAKGLGQDFTTIEHVPERMKRYEQWELDYRRNPYMRGNTDEQIRERLDEIMCVTSLAFIIASPHKPGEDAIMWSMQSMSHVMLEMGWRAIPITQFPQEPWRLATAARRLGFPPHAVAWFDGMRDTAA